MSARSPRSVVTLLAGAAACAGAYATLIEPNLYTLRRFRIPVLDPGTRPLRLLHISDLHMTRNQRRKQAWVSSLARLSPDFVINTGDTSSDPDGLAEVLASLGPLLDFPGGFVPGNNDYYVPTFKNPMRYFMADKVGSLEHHPPMPWGELAEGMSKRGWLDLTHQRASLDLAGARVALAGTDDPQLRRARYEQIAGPAAPDAEVRIGVIHSPEPRLLQRFAGDGYDLVVAGHTHGGQVRVPFGPAIVTNCGIDVRRARWLHRWDDHMWFHICAGLGTNPYLPLRFACRPEASLLTLVPRDA